MGFGWTPHNLVSPLAILTSSLGACNYGRVALVSHVTPPLSISNLDDYTLDVRNILSSLPNTHPLCPASVQALTMAFHSCYVVWPEAGRLQFNSLLYTGNILHTSLGGNHLEQRFYQSLRAIFLLAPESLALLLAIP